MPMWKIQKYRIKGGYSQERLAEAVDLSTSYVSEIETGKKRPSMKTLEKIAAVLGVPLVALLDEGPEVEQKKDVHLLWKILLAAAITFVGCNLFAGM